MSVPYSGTIRRSAGLISALGKQLKLVNLKPVKRVQVKFDPFGAKITSTRSFLYYITGSKVAGTNTNCTVKTEVVCDRTPPSITFNLASGDNVVLQCQNLTTLELLQLCNKYVSSQATPDEPIEDTKLKSKKPTSKKR